MKLLFIDPGTKSTGWALFEQDVLVDSGTVTTDSKDFFVRLQSLWTQYQQVGALLEPDEVRFERMNRVVHHAVMWSVSVIGVALLEGGAKRVCGADSEQISPTAWQKYVDWKGSRKPLSDVKDKVKSEDELAAIGIGLWWVDNNGKEE